MQKRTYYKTMFTLSALWNWSFAVPGFFASGYLFKLFPMEQAKPTVGGTDFWFYLFLSAAFLLGLGYYMVGRDIDKNHGIVILGIVGKIGAAGIFLAYFILGKVHGLFFIAALGDSIFTVLFIEFLVNYKKLPNKL